MILTLVVAGVHLHVPLSTCVTLDYGDSSSGTVVVCTTGDIGEVASVGDVIFYVLDVSLRRDTGLVQGRCHVEVKIFHH